MCDKKMYTKGVFLIQPDKNSRGKPVDYKINKNILDFLKNGKKIHPANTDLLLLGKKCDQCVTEIGYYRAKIRVLSQ